MGIVVRYLGGVIEYFRSANLTGFNLAVSVISVVRIKSSSVVSKRNLLK